MDLQKEHISSISDFLEQQEEFVIRTALCEVVTKESAFRMTASDTAMVFRILCLKGEFICYNMSTKKTFRLYQNNRLIFSYTWHGWDELWGQ